MLVFRKCVMFTKQGGTAVYEDYIVLDRVKSVKDFFNEFKYHKGIWSHMLAYE